MRYDERVRQRLAFLKSARNVARSGDHADWESVVAAMQQGDEFRDVREWLEDDRSIRAQLNQLCLAARKGETVPRGPRGARPAPPRTGRSSRHLVRS